MVNSKKRIGILTFHCAHNYGAVLQCYALQEFLKDEGYDVSIIDYRPDFLINIYKVFNYRRFISKNISHLIKELCLLYSRHKRYNGFRYFIDNKLNVAKGNLEDFNQFDTIIIGSDQVWNIKLAGRWEPYYWGYFTNFKGKVISYAASMEEMSLRDDDKEYLRKSLLNFSSISVRELSLVEYLAPYVGCKNISFVADPTLILEKRHWDNIAIKPQIDKYVLLYQVRNDNFTQSVAQAIAKKLHLKLIILSARIDLKNSSICRCASPQEFVGFFKYASFVVSASFHGTVFATLFNIPFYSVLLGDGRDQRVLSFLQAISCEKYGISRNDIISSVPNYRWEDINNKLKHLKEPSINYLYEEI